MPQRAGLVGGIDAEAEHPRQLPSHLELELDGDRRDVLDDVVRVVERRHQLGDEPRQEEVRHHVPEVARVEGGHRALQRRGQLVELVPRPGEPVEVRAGVLVVRADGRLVLGMEVAPPVDVVAHQLEQRLLEEVVVLAVRAEEERGERIRHGRSSSHRARLAASTRALTQDLRGRGRGLLLTFRVEEVGRWVW